MTERRLQGGGRGANAGCGSHRGGVIAGGDHGVSRGAAGGVAGEHGGLADVVESEVEEDHPLQPDAWMKDTK